jgi:hypothetical protein
VLALGFAYTLANIDIYRGISYADLKSNLPICESYVAAMRAMGHHTLLDNSTQKSTLAGASTDMGAHQEASLIIQSLLTNRQAMFHTKSPDSTGSSRFLPMALTTPLNSRKVLAQKKDIRGHLPAQRAWLWWLVRFWLMINSPKM